MRAEATYALLLLALQITFTYCATTRETVAGSILLRHSTKELRFRRRTKVVLVLGTGCNATFFDYEAEAQCSAEFAIPENYERNRWRRPQPPCDHLPVTNKTAEIELGWRELFATDYRMAYTAVLRRAAPFLKEIGWKQLRVVAYKSAEEALHVPTADVVIAPQTEFQLDLHKRYCSKQFIVVHTDDPATISPYLDVNSPQILGLLMHDSFTNLSENNMPSPYMTRHSAWMMTKERLAGLAPDLLWHRDPPITEANLRAKVHTIIPQIMRWMHPLDCGGNPEFVLLKENALGMSEGFSVPLHQRTIDITFVGYVGSQWKQPKEQPGNGTEVWTETMRARTGVMEHRQFAIGAILRLRDKYGLNVVTDTGQRDYKDFIQLLQDTKIFVSPFGIGEFSGKDYEAMMAGALVAKPLLRKFESYPNIYSSHFMLETEVDFSDLEEVLMPYLLDEDKLRSRGQEKVDKGQKLLKKYSKIGPLVEHFDQVLYRILQQEEFGIRARGEECYHSLVTPPKLTIPKFLHEPPPLVTAGDTAASESTSTPTSTPFPTPDPPASRAGRTLPSAAMLLLCAVSPMVVLLSCFA
jgi:hypothetical protein